VTPPHVVAETSLTVFVPTRLVNPTNERAAHWGGRATRAKRQRAAVAMAVWAALRNPSREARMTVWRITAKPETPKHITLTGHVARKLDGDGLQAALKHCRDGLIDCGLIHDDGPDSGHRFDYAQVVRAPTGVLITVALA
jgi:hypothetical protein